jgi:hypothetical protein
MKTSERVTGYGTIIDKPAVDLASVRLARRPQPCANPGIGHALGRFGTDI